MPRVSENMNTKTEAVVHAELERYMFKARDILLKNMTFLKKAAALLLEKETLLYSDIRALRESVTIVRVPV
jgi:ATP-dependent Zn protease